MGHRWRPRGKVDPEDEAREAEPAIVLGSSDDDEDDEGNEDLTLAILEKARQREAMRRGSEGGGDAVASAMVVNLSSSSDDDEEGEVEEGERTKKTKKSTKKNKREKMKSTHVDESEIPQVVGTEEEPLGTAESVLTEVNETSDNAVLRKLLRGPRYFDPMESKWETCFNCGEEGHVAASCTMEKRQKPCFVCGLFGHSAKQCTQGQDCFICKRRGHIAKDCPDKNKKISQDSKICLRCGDVGHDMFSCRNNYPPDDMKEIQCYICQKHGHLCCAEFAHSNTTEVSCYNCAQAGHAGSGCAKPRGEVCVDASPTLCYKCGEEGHFARGCTKKSRLPWMDDAHGKKGESSTPSWKSAKEKRDLVSFRSVPHDIGKASKRKSFAHEQRETTSFNSRIKGGWIVDDPGDLPTKRYKSKGWASPSTPVQRGHGSHYLGSGGKYASSSESFKKQKQLRKERSSEQGVETENLMRLRTRLYLSHAWGLITSCILCNVLCLEQL
uniref:CCHC-type domain-containing protein n=1 Tax=Ananas comosus var. bracteatus TaxID=296719 RepID=A0A6V7NVJ7_ANACO|nr:unnamed protein product [Ananas comosus var. bracteatus]